jgi:hypothetical protein
MKPLSNAIKPVLQAAIVLLISGCSLAKAPLTSPNVLTTPERDQVLEYAQPASDNLLAGLNARDYAQFSRDFNDNMKTGMDEASFEDLLSMLDSKLGTYLSSDLVTVLQDEKFNTVIYRLTYSKDNEAVMRVVFDRSEPHQISGLWFDSPELRGP